MKKKNPYKKIGERLKLLRGDLTQKEFSAAVGLSERAYQRYEYGERLPGLEVIFRIAAFCNVPWNKVLSQKDKKALFDEKTLKNFDIVIKKFNDDFSTDDNITGFLEELHSLRVKGHSIKHKLGVPEDSEEYYWIEPRLNESIVKLKYIFNYASEDVIEFVLDILENAAKAATFGYNMEGKIVQKNQLSDLKSK